MSTYYATFFTHYGALVFRRYCQQQGISCTLMPVPRSLSSSCGTCASFASGCADIGFADDALEGVYRYEAGVFHKEAVACHTQEQR